MPLTDVAVRTAKSRETPYKLSDGGGLYLLVKPDGARYWRMDYRWVGKRSTLAFGVYPTITLGSAREKRENAKKSIAAGVNPAAQRKLDKIASEMSNKNTFRAVGDEWIAKIKREGRSDSTLSKMEWMLGLAYPVIGDRPVSEVSAPEILEALRRVEARGRFETARRLRSTCGQVFRYAIATGRATRDPSTDLRGALTAPKVKHRSAITDPAALGALLTNAVHGGSRDYISFDRLRSSVTHPVSVECGSRYAKPVFLGVP